MNSSPRVIDPPSTGVVLRATLDVLAEQGPGRAAIRRIARLAATYPRFLQRNWPSREALLRYAVTAELNRVLGVAGDLARADTPVCLLADQVVRAVRIIRDHPVTRTTARTDPALLRGALLRLDAPVFRPAWKWLNSCVACLPERSFRHRQDLPSVLLTLAAPYALTPPEAVPEGAQLNHLDALVRDAVHVILAAPRDCPDCGTATEP